jgi:teichuronic acid biosynthesis glycosyltransferase TuaG
MSSGENRLVSVITPAYNVAPFIGETIQSVLAQTYENWELLISDDCSTDGTLRVVLRYAASDSRIRVLPGEVNGGPSVARNRALAAARGGWVAFLDSDDVWLTNKLERQLDFMRVNGACFCFTQYRRISEAGGVPGRVVKIPRRMTYKDLLKNTAIATSTVLINRKATGPFNMTETYYDDYVLWLELLKRGMVAYGLQEDLVRYRVVGRSVSRNKLRSAKWVWRTYRDIERLSIPQALTCFLNYSGRALLKYRQF